MKRDIFDEFGRNIGTVELAGGDMLGIAVVALVFLLLYWVFELVYNLLVIIADRIYLAVKVVEQHPKGKVVLTGAIFVQLALISLVVNLLVGTILLVILNSLRH